MTTKCEVVVAPLATLQQQLRHLVQEAAQRALAEGRRVSLAIPGGSVAAQLLSALRADDIDWGATDVFWCDERAVAPTHPDSNYGTSVAGWLGALVVSGVRLHRMHGDAPSLDDAARRYDEELSSSLGSPPRLDLAIVGVGEDGHVCSLFPGHPALREADRLAVAVRDAPKPPPARLTLTLPFVAASRRVVVAALGSSKAGAMRAALGDTPGTTPVAQLLQLTERAVVLLDLEAARDLGH